MPMFERNTRRAPVETRVINLRLRPEEFRAIETIAIETGSTLSDTIRDALAAYFQSRVNNHGPGPE